MSGAAVIAAAALAAPAPTMAVSPSHLVLAPGASRLVHVEAAGSGPVTVTAAVAGFALDVRGRPRIVAAGDAAPWLRLSPRATKVPRRGAAIAVSVRAAPKAAPGDHSAVVVLSATQPRSGIAVRVRIGLVVTVRMPGKVVHRLAVRSARVHRNGRSRVVELAVANSGNVIEQVGRAALRVAVLRGGRVVASPGPARRELLPHTTGVVTVPVGAKVRGRVTLRVTLRPPTAGVRRFRLQL